MTETSPNRGSKPLGEAFPAHTSMLTPPLTPDDTAEVTPAGLLQDLG
jgi:hypothetical protein